MKKSDYLTKVFPVTKMVTIPLYSSIDLVDGKLVGEIEEYINTPIEWLQHDIRKEN